MRRTAWLASAALGVAGTLGAYPLDGFEGLGIRRLKGYATRQAATSGTKLPPGALLGSDEVRLSLPGHPSLDVEGFPKDPALQAALEAMLAKRHPSYSVAVVDITDPEDLAWAGVRAETAQVPGSVGKLGVMVGFFDALARAYPDLEARRRVLTEHVVKASDWALGDRHAVPKLDPKTGRNVHGKIVAGERYTLAEWVDHMVSVSANSAGSMVWKEAMLLRHFGAEYPVSPEREKAFFAATPKAELQALSLATIEDPLKAAGIRAHEFRQGTMFTWAGKQAVPGTASFATPLGLVRILLRLEQGRLVDAWSSLEMKRFLYVTKRRVRYIYAPELGPAAVYFKSGSMYGCSPEPGFACGQFMGNRMNLMNSVAIVESPARPGVGPGPTQKRYLVALMSNVLKKNSAWEHSRIAAAIDEAVRTRQAAVIEDAPATGSAGEVGDDREPEGE